MAKNPDSTPAVRVFSVRRLSCELSKSLSPWNGTVEVSWFTRISAVRPLPSSSSSSPPRLLGTIEIPSGIDSNRYVLPGSVSPTVMIGVTLLHVGQSSIAAWVVLKPAGDR